MVYLVFLNSFSCEFIILENQNIINKIALLDFLYYNFTYGGVEMDFFRNNKKIIVGIIAVSFILWTVGMGIALLIPSFGG